MDITATNSGNGLHKESKRMSPVGFSGCLFYFRFQTGTVGR